MKRAPVYPRRMALLPAVLLLSSGPVASAWAIEPGLDLLRAEVRPLKEVNDPSQPIWVRFSLCNPTDQPIEIPLMLPAADKSGAGLPAELLFGPPGKSAIAVGYSSEQLTSLASPVAGTPGEGRTLLLGSHSSIGADIDLRGQFRAMRYDGIYRVEWRPLGDRVQGAAADVRVERRKDAILITDLGKLTFALGYEQAPRNVENFLELVRTGFYDGKTLHRIVPGFIIQGGCPHGDGSGIRPDGRLIHAEFNNTPIETGTLLMARKPTDPNSASCQFFIALGRLPELDGQYTIVGQIRDDESLRTLQALGAIPTTKADRPLQSVVIRSIKLIDAQPPTTTRATQ